MRRTEIGKKYFKLTHFEEVFTFLVFIDLVLPIFFSIFNCISIDALNLILLQVFTTHHWMVRIYKLKPPKNRLRGKSKKKTKLVRYHVCIHTHFAWLADISYSLYIPCIIFHENLICKITEIQMYQRINCSSLLARQSSKGGKSSSLKKQEKRNPWH